VSVVLEHGPAVLAEVRMKGANACKHKFLFSTFVSPKWPSCLRFRAVNSLHESRWVDLLAIECWQRFEGRSCSLCIERRASNGRRAAGGWEIVTGSHVMSSLHTPPHIVRSISQSTLLLTLRPSCSAPMPEMTSWTSSRNCACTSSDS
jgi:hypothetical protein